MIPNATEAAYARGTTFERRRRLMADWAASPMSCVRNTSVCKRSQPSDTQSMAVFSQSPLHGQVLMIRANGAEVLWRRNLSFTSAPNPSLKLAWI